MVLNSKYTLEVEGKLLWPVSERRLASAPEGVRTRAAPAALGGSGMARTQVGAKTVGRGGRREPPEDVTGGDLRWVLCFLLSAGHLKGLWLLRAPF